MRWQRLRAAECGHQSKPPVGSGVAQSLDDVAAQIPGLGDSVFDGCSQFLRSVPVLILGLVRVLRVLDALRIPTRAILIVPFVTVAIAVHIAIPGHTAAAVQQTDALAVGAMSGGAIVLQLRHRDRSRVQLVDWEKIAQVVSNYE